MGVLGIHFDDKSNDYSEFDECLFGQIVLGGRCRNVSAGSIILKQQVNFRFICR